jgi:hypothetical protein
MQEKHQVKFLNTFCDYRQFQLKPETTNFIVGEYDNLYFIYNNLGYKIHKVGARVKKQTDDSKPLENMGNVFYFERDTNIAFQIRPDTTSFNVREFERRYQNLI